MAGKQHLRSARRWAADLGVLVVAACLVACSAPAAGAATTGKTGVVAFGALLSGKSGQPDRAAPTPVTGIAGRVVQVTTSNSDGYALTASGTVWAWGLGTRGELGDGGRVAVARTAVKVSFPSGVRISSLAVPMPYDGGLAIDSRGHAWGWGVDGSGQLCLPHSGPVLRPAQLPLSHVTLVTGAGNHALFDAAGVVYACGAGDRGQLGDGATAEVSTPTRVVGLPSGGVESLTSSWKGSGALMSNGSYFDWGYNQAGQLGDGTTTDSDVPVAVSLPDAAVAVSQGGSGPNNGQTLALLADGSLWAWGNGQWGQLGTGATGGSAVPARVALPNGVAVASMSSGGYSCYAVDTSGHLWSWGRNQLGQLGTGRRGTSHAVPRTTGVTLTEVSSTATNVAGLGGR